MINGAKVIPVIERKKHFKVTGVFEDLGLGEVIYDINSSADFEEHIKFVDDFYENFEFNKVEKEKK